MTKKTSCSIVDCNRGGKIVRDLCKMHYLRWLSHGDGFDRSPDFRESASSGAPKAFADQAIISDTDACIIWPYATNVGYGVVTINGKMRRAHRYVLEQVSGPPPTSKHEAAHAPDICHNRACINHKHLRWATNIENQADRLIDGTDTRGEKHGRSKLTCKQVLEIYKRAHNGENQTRLGEEFGVSDVAISHIKSGKTWSHTTGHTKSLQKTS